MQKERLRLEWSQFEPNISGYFSDLRTDSDLFDVTLASTESGGRFVQAHKLILSASSLFFKNLLKQQNRQVQAGNPIIYLKGVSYENISNLLDYMYHGEVSITEDELGPFMSLAQELKIKGLCNEEVVRSSSSNPLRYQYNRTNDKKQEELSDANKLRILDIGADVERVPFKGTFTDNDFGTENLKSIKMEEKDDLVSPRESINEKKYRFRKRNAVDELGFFNDPLYEKQEEYKESIAGENFDKSYTRIKGKEFKCKICEYVGRDKTMIREHIASKHSSEKRPCPYCQRLQKAGGSLRKHMYKCPKK